MEMEVFHNETAQVLGIGNGNMFSSDNVYGLQEKIIFEEYKMTDVEIREATPDDAAQLIAYVKRVGGETENLTFGSEGMGLSAEQEADFVRNINSDDHSIFLCAWKKSELVGTANLCGLPRRMSHRAELGISVVKSEWNRGIGTKLMQSLIDYAKQKGIEIINLEVRSDNSSAKHLYEKFGFEKTGSIPAFYKIGSKYVDFDLMSLDLRK